MSKFNLKLFDKFPRDLLFKVFFYLDDFQNRKFKYFTEKVPHPLKECFDIAMKCKMCEYQLFCCRFCKQPVMFVHYDKSDFVETFKNIINISDDKCLD
jgi:hypothetical protein